ncbi:nucleobase-ascorbate transporter 12-like isoform X2 [Magnolia sinica]|uniref:nucleobase-ascorbate transporter 12-like isoform X2 n=1 Tax=Magnolia sinica TaxID=86752 RepID=UPI0026580571|nr:nucleobase-ascorbate transporter 12-like isoform X2 [Magnolia sinica]
MSTSDAPKRARPGPWPPVPPTEPTTSAMPASSWAKKTGFKPRLSGDTNASDSGQIVAAAAPVKPREAEPQPDLESGRAVRAVNGGQEPDKMPATAADRDLATKKKKESDGGAGVNGQLRSEPPPVKHTREEEVVDALPQSYGDEGFVARHSHMKYELRDTPGLVPIGLYGFQHYLSIMGSLILIPLVIVPAMGGTHSFKHIMKELQGAIIISSAFQAIMGYSGLMSIFLRLINPVVLSPTIAAVGLSFFSYGFPQVGTCLEIGILQILVVIIFSLYLRKVSVFGHRIFLIYAVPLGLAITWAVAFLLTEAGAYNYKGCDINVPASNIISDACRKHVSRMKHCRVDTSRALKSSPWFRFPYPLQWGVPVFDWKMAIVMCAVSIIASVDSVGSYHASSLLVASRPPTPGVLSRGLGLEGLSSVLAGLWGTGTGSTTLTENVHTIAVTKMGSRRAVELGAIVLILLSLVGKVGGFLASIPDVMVAALLCFMWGMLAALGLSNLRYSEAGSSRNIIIVGLSLFFSLSIPAYFQQYGVAPNANSPVPRYFQPYIVASHGPFRSKYGGLNYVMNTVLSFHMVIAFLVALILDNTVPGSRQERGVYVWSEAEVARREPAIAKDYELPFRVGRVFRWVKWVGL